MDKIRTPHFTRGQVRTAERLLDMLYKPSEIAEEIEVDVRTVYRSYLPAGCPSSKDDRGNIWIHGVSFSNWARSISESAHKSKIPYGKDECYCVHCRKRVSMSETTSKKAKNTRGNVLMVRGKCSTCGHSVVKFMREE